MGGCTWHVAHPGGRHFERFPVNAFEAESRRTARFFPIGHSGGPLAVPPPEQNRDYPLTLDLRRPVSPAEVDGPDGAAGRAGVPPTGLESRRGICSWMATLSRCLCRRQISVLRGSFQRKLKSSGDNTRHRDVFVQFFPTQRKPVQLELDRTQLFRRRALELPKTIGGEADDPAIRKLQKHHPLFYPDADGSRLG